MLFSIHTREADNGFILDVDVKDIRRSKNLKPCHEVYTDWADVKRRMGKLVGEFLVKIEEMIPEKVPKLTPGITKADYDELKEKIDELEKERRGKERLRPTPDEAAKMEKKQ